MYFYSFGIRYQITSEIVLGYGGLMWLLFYDGGFPAFSCYVQH
jgi:hypothetical protein